ncbi:conserved hypothetical protein [Ricinus communis]|uniref:Uncharacterized protein n=1 Tax=Ricinus communis TaxID=3988 RepID=B9RU95_RICCO|nr:conserved hypothetical protein [Ricinus communis]
MQQKMGTEVEKWSAASKEEASYLSEFHTCCCMHLMYASRPESALIEEIIKYV